MNLPKINISKGTAGTLGKGASMTYSYGKEKITWFQGDDDTIINLDHVKRIRYEEKTIYFVYPDEDFDKRTFENEDSAIEVFKYLKKNL